MAVKADKLTDSAYVDELSEKMLRVLAAQRLLGDGAYPLTLQKLGHLTDSKAKAKQIIEAARNKKFQDAAIVSRKSELDAPVALLNDVTLLAESPLVHPLRTKPFRQEQD